MKTILQEIADIRQGKPIVIDYSNRNRYCVVLSEADGSKTAYCFGTPVYNLHSRQAVSFRFQYKDNNPYLIGSNSVITVFEDAVRLENAEGSSIVHMEKSPLIVGNGRIQRGKDVIFPTANGFAHLVTCSKGNTVSFIVEVDRPFLQIRTNDRCFALMSEEFRPFLTVSCIGTVQNNTVTAPVTLHYEKMNDRCYQIHLTSGKEGDIVLFECNLYESKLFQDTTVESKNPQTNNAFGGMAFLGCTEQYGEQWLYSRIDFSKLSELFDKRIKRAVWHVPKFNYTDIALTGIQLEARFCSFGSNWENKVEASRSISRSTQNGRYLDMDLSSLIADAKTGSFRHAEGIILKPECIGTDCVTVSTGDSYYAPQILEINFR